MPPFQRIQKGDKDQKKSVRSEPSFNVTEIESFIQNHLEDLSTKHKCSYHQKETTTEQG